MADITITAGNVIGYGTRLQGVAGGTITAGLAVQKNSSGEIVAASDDTATNAAAVGVALCGASSGQPVYYQQSGLIDIGGTVDIGKVYVLSTSGGIAPVDDIAGSEFVTVLGIGTTTALIKLGINASGVAAAGGVT